MLHPEEIKGYVFVEGDVKDVEKALAMIPHIRGLIKKPVDLEQIRRFLLPKTVEVKLDMGDIVEVQATGEKRGFSRAEFDALFGLAEKGCGELFAMQKAAVG